MSKENKAQVYYVRLRAQMREREKVGAIIHTGHIAIEWQVQPNSQDRMALGRAFSNACADGWMEQMGNRSSRYRFLGLDPETPPLALVEDTIDTPAVPVVVPKPPERLELVTYMVTAIGRSAKTRELDTVSTPEVQRLVANMCTPIPPSSVWGIKDGPWAIAFRRGIQEMVGVGWVQNGTQTIIQLDWMTAVYWVEAEINEEDGGFRLLAQQIQRAYDKGARLPARWGAWTALLIASAKLIRAQGEAVSGP